MSVVERGFQEFVDYTKFEGSGRPAGGHATDCDARRWFHAVHGLRGGGRDGRGGD
jgi:hypothetical protein